MKILIAFIVAISALVYFGYQLEEIRNDVPISSEVIEYGTIISIDGCRTSKYSNKCFIRTTTHQWNAETKNYPLGYFQVGDRMYHIKYTFNKAADRVAYCKNDLCFGLPDSVKNKN